MPSARKASNFKFKTMAQLSLFTAPAGRKKVRISALQRRRLKAHKKELEKLGYNDVLIAEIRRYDRRTNLVVSIFKGGALQATVVGRLRSNARVFYMTNGQQIYDRNIRCSMKTLPNGMLLFKLDGIQRTEQVILDCLGLNGFQQGIPPLRGHIHRYSTRILVFAEGPMNQIIFKSL